MMQRDLDLDVYFPLTLARRAFGDTIDEARSRLHGAQEHRAVGDLAAGRATSKMSRPSPAIAENVVLKDRTQGWMSQVKAPIQILRTAEQQQRHVQLHHGRHRRASRWWSAASAS